MSRLPYLKLTLGDNDFHVQPVKSSSFYSSSRIFTILKLQKQRKGRNFSTGVGSLTDFLTINEDLIFFFGKSGAYFCEVSQKPSEPDLTKVFNLTAE